MSYWPHSNPEPTHDSQLPTDRAPAGSPCPGICNRDWRKAEREQRRLEDIEKQLAQIQERAPKWIPPHVIPAEAGAPIWCEPCTKRIARSLLSLPDLYVQLELDKMHGTRKAERDPNSRHAPKAAAAPSPSPPVDEQDGMSRFLADWEDQVRDAFGFSHRPARLPTARPAPRRVWLGFTDRPPQTRPPVARSLAALAASAESETMMGAVRFLTVHLEGILAAEQLSRDFGRGVVAEATELRRRTSMHEQRTRKKAPCPRCRLKTLVHEGGDDYVWCENPSYGMGPCGRLLSLQEYDELEDAMPRPGAKRSTATGESA